MPSPKDGFNDQFGLASADGTRAGAGAAFATGAAGDGLAPLVDLEGRLYLASAPPPLPGYNTAWETSSGAALTNDTQLFPGPGLLEQVSGFVQAAADVSVNYVQIYDLAGAPAGSPLQTIRVVGSQVWSWSPQRWRFGTGIRFAVSTAPLTYVAGDLAFYNALGWVNV